jgi:uncharacterized protein YdhG (YjbR/CyaY superfamily)
MRLASKDIDEYIGLQSESTRGILSEIRQTIKKAVPEAEELINYQMPAFRFHGMLVWYAAFKNHFSIFIRPHILSVFKDELIPFELSESKSAIKIPLNCKIWCKSKPGKCTIKNQRGKIILSFIYL